MDTKSMAELETLSLPGFKEAEKSLVVFNEAFLVIIRRAIAVWLLFAILKLIQNLFG